MAKITIPSDVATNTGYTPLPEGTYDFRVVSIEQKTSSTGNQQFEFQLEVIGGPSAGRKLRSWYSLTDKAMWRLNQLYTALGIEGEGPDGTVYDSDWLVDRALTFDVHHRIWNGKTNLDFKNPRASEYDVDDSDDVEEAEAPKAKAPRTMRRRPRAN